MAIRDDLVNSAVTFLQDPSVSSSPIENRIAFLQSKNLTQEEVDAALARAGGESAPSYPNYAPQQQVVRQQAPPNYGGYQQYPWQQPPPELPKRDWRDWFIMATVMGGVGYGLYTVAKRYVYPMIAPPTAPQLEQDKQAIDESFEKAFALLDQLAKDTETLKNSEEARTERLDAALLEVETVVGELKAASRRREDESRRISDEVRGLKDLIPLAMQSQKESSDTRLKELNTELKSLKTLMGQRMNPPQTSTPASSYGRASGATLTNGASTPTTPSAVNTSSPISDSITPKPASVSNGTGTESSASIQSRTSSPFGSGAPGGRASIPAWQKAAANKNTSSDSNGTTGGSGSASQEASGSA